MPVAPSEPESTHRLRSRIFKFLAIFAAVLGVFVLALIAALHTPAAKRFVLSQVTKVLAEQQIDLNADGLNYNLFNLSLALRGIKVRSLRAPEAPPFAVISGARVDLRLVPLLRGRYEIESGELEGIEIHYFVDEGGLDNLPRPIRKADEPEKPLDYLISKFLVTHATVRYENRLRDLEVTLPISNLEVKGDRFSDRHVITVQSAGGSARIQERRVHLDRLAGSIDLGEDDVRVEQLALDTEGSRLTLIGTVRDFDETAQADLTLRARLDAARATTAARLAEKVGGVIEIDGTAKGNLAAPTLQAQIRGSDVQFRNVDRVQLAVTATYDMTDRRVELSRVDVRSPVGAITGEGSIATAGSGPSHLRAAVSSLDAEAAVRLFNLPYAIASRADARVDAKWTGLDYLAATGSADATLVATRGGAEPSVLPVSGRLHVDAAPGRIVAAMNALRVAGADVNGRVALRDQRQLQGSLQTRIADVGQTIRSAEAFLGRRTGSPTPVAVRGTVDAQATVGGTLQSPAVSARVNAPALSLGAADGLALTSDIAYTPAALRIDRVDLLWGDATAYATGRIGLTGARPLDVSIKADALDIPQLVAAFSQATVPVTGSISVQAATSGTLSRPVSTVSLQAINLSAFKETLGTLDASASVVGQEVNLNRAELTKPQPGGDGHLKATGRYNLTSRSYTFDARSDNVQLLTATLPDGLPLTGAVTLTANGSGTLADPTANANLVVNDLRVGDYDLGAVLAQAVVASQQATIKATAERFRLHANANIGVQRPYPTAAAIQIQDLDLATIPVDFQTPLQGQLRARVDAAGDLAAPERGRVTANIDAFSGAWNSQPFSIDTPALLRYAEERLQIDRLRVNAQDSTITVTGELPLTTRAEEGALQIDARANLATLTKFAPAGSAISGDGALVVAGTVRGTLEAIDPDLVVTIENASLRAPQSEPGLSNVQLRARVVGGEATIEQLAANWGPARIDVVGRVPLEVVPRLPVEIPHKGGPASFKATLRNLDPATLPGAPAGLTGQIALDAQLQATRAALEALEGQLTFPELQLAFSGLTLAQQQPTAIEIAGGTARIQTLDLSGTAGTLAAHGSVSLEGERALDLTAKGNLNVGAVTLFTDKVRTEGQSTLQLTARGTLASPDVRGSIEVNNATVVSEEPNIVAEAVSARVDLEGPRMTLSTLTANVNGGTLNGSGFVALGEGGVRDLDLQVETHDFAFDAPLELRSLSDANLHVTRRGEEFLVDGQVTITEAGLTNDINLDQGLLASIAEPRKLDLTEERNPLLERVRFNVNVDTATPILIDNNLAEAEVITDLRVVGTPYETGLTGRLTVQEGGQLTLNERRYRVERGEIVFVDERRIAPSFDLALATSAQNYDISVLVSGTPDDTETVLRSDPELPEPDIMALLVTGRTVDEMRGEEFEVAREQMLSYMAGRLGSRLGRGVERATGLSEVRIEPNLIANETDPTARLTVAQELTDQLQLVYSTNLTDSSDQIWVAEYDITHRFQTRTTRQSDDTYRLDFHHDVRFGGVPAPVRQQRKRPVVARVEITGDAAADEPIQKLFKVEAGDEFDFFAARRGVERIQRFYFEQGRLQSRVRLEREPSDGPVNLRLRIVRGPRVEPRFEGPAPPASVIKDVRTRWHRGVFDAQRADDGAEVLRAWLMQDGHLQAKVSYMIDDVSADQRRVVFRMEPGPRSTKVMLVFEGASGIKPKELDRIIEDQKLEQQLFTDAIVVTELLERYYREQGFLIAAIAKPRYEFSGTIARVVLPVNEGPRFTIRELRTSGTSVFDTTLLIGELPLTVGDPFLPAAAENARQRIRQLYWNRGYNDVRVEYDLAMDRKAGQLDVTFGVKEGPQAVVADIVIAGNQKTSERLVREQLELSPEQPLDLSALSRSRRNLYDTGAYSVVDVTREPLAGDVPAAGSPDSQPPLADVANQKPVRLSVALREEQPFQLRYGASFDTERGVGGLLDISNHNSLGKARVVGLRGRYDSQLHEARLYMSQPTLRYFPVQLTAALFYREERNPVTDVTNPFNIDRLGASLQGETKLRNLYVWSYGYRYERARTFDPAPGGVLDRTTTVSPLTTTFTRETRDEVLDASKGAFTSQAFAYSPSWLGSDATYIKYFGQYFHYFPLQPERRRPFSNEILRPRLVYAAGVRIGLAHPIDSVVPESERFFAGGSTTLRGFAQNAVGPIGPDGIPLGGEAVLVINNELRFPLIAIFDGVVFSDIGNVFREVSEFSLSDLRKSAGVGLRVRTPWFLVRGDYGFVLDPRAGERRSRFYFSIGQAF
jgi:outer membrane protein assembly complex protein YaeT